MSEKINHFNQVASAVRYQITSGESEGLNVIDCNNGKIRFLLNESKGLDIMQLYHQGVNVSFISKNGFTSREINFDNRFEGGMLYTCGFDSVGGREGYETHGSYHLTKANVTKIECLDSGITIEAELRNSALFGKNLLIKRKVYTEINGDSVTVSDTLINEAYRPENYSVLYHVNFGYPMLDEGAYITADIEKTTPRTDWAKQNLTTFNVIEAPTPLKEETCYYHNLKTPKISLTNEKLGKKCTLTYSNDTLDKFIEWKSMASGDYALGLEPTTTLLDENFKYKVIPAKSSVEFFVKITVENV